MSLNDSQKCVLAAMRTDLVAPLTLLEAVYSHVDVRDPEEDILLRTVESLKDVIEALDSLATGNSTLLKELGL